MRHHDGMSDEVLTVTLRVRGVVQGVGFRPFVYRIGNGHGLAGWVKNDGEGVLVEATGTAPQLDAFARALVEEAPFAADVESVTEVTRRTASDEAHVPISGVFPTSKRERHDSPRLVSCPSRAKESYSSTK